LIDNELVNRPMRGVEECEERAHWMHARYANELQQSFSLKKRNK